VIGGQTVLAIIPARGGSKRLPGKNLMEVGGLSLLARTITQAQQSRYVDTVVVSTDDAAIMREATKYGADIIERPADRASDTATTEEVVEHALFVTRGYDIFVLLQPTSPLREPHDIDACIDRVSEGEEAAVSVTSAPKPALVYWHSMTGEIIPAFTHSSSLARNGGEAVLLNGAVYCLRPETFRRSLTLVPAGTVGHLMPKDRSIDIDTEEDLTAARRAVGDLMEAA
jgi:CMP-N,N'-diacetyllegionaminic acid synthase